jgi:hypothetical protein
MKTRQRAPNKQITYFVSIDSIVLSINGGTITYPREMASILRMFYFCKKKSLRNNIAEDNSDKVWGTVRGIKDIDKKSTREHYRIFLSDGSPITMTSSGLYGRLREPRAKERSSSLESSLISDGNIKFHIGGLSQYTSGSSESTQCKLHFIRWILYHFGGENINIESLHVAVDIRHDFNDLYVNKKTKRKISSIAFKNTKYFHLTSERNFKNRRQIKIYNKRKKDEVHIPLTRIELVLNRKSLKKASENKHGFLRGISEIAVVSFNKFEYSLKGDLTMKIEITKEKIENELKIFFMSIFSKNHLYPQNYLHTEIKCIKEIYHKVLNFLNDYGVDYRNLPMDDALKYANPKKYKFKKLLEKSPLSQNKMEQDLKVGKKTIKKIFTLLDELRQDKQKLSITNDTTIDGVFPSYYKQIDIFERKKMARLSIAAKGQQIKTLIKLVDDIFNTNPDYNIAIKIRAKIFTQLLGERLVHKLLITNCPLEYFQTRDFFNPQEPQEVKSRVIK